MSQTTGAKSMFHAQFRLSKSVWRQQAKPGQAKGPEPPGGAQEPQDQTEDDEGLQYRSESLPSMDGVDLLCKSKEERINVKRW